MVDQPDPSVVDSIPADPSTTVSDDPAVIRGLIVTSDDDGNKIVELPAGVDPSVMAEVAMQDDAGNRLVPLDSIPENQPINESSLTQVGDTVMVSPVAPTPNADPFPDAPWPTEGYRREIIVSAQTGSKHGGFFRQNPDATISFKPTSYIGPIVTGQNRDAIAALLP